MLRYKLKYYSIESIEPVEKIQYKCLVCGYIHDWDDTWSPEKKEEVKIEVDKHHEDHIVPQS
jgi:hypothetical protein